MTLQASEGSATILGASLKSIRGAKPDEIEDSYMTLKLLAETEAYGLRQYFAVVSLKPVGRWKLDELLSAVDPWTFWLWERVTLANVWELMEWLEGKELGVLVTLEDFQDFGLRYCVRRFFPLRNTYVYGADVNGHLLPLVGV